MSQSDLESLFHHKYLLCQFIQLHGFIHKSLHWWLKNIQSGPVPLTFSHVHLDVIKPCLILFIKTEFLIFLGQLSWTQQMTTSPLFGNWGQTIKLDSSLFVYPISYSWTYPFSNTLKYIQKSEGFPGGSVLKNPPANAGDTGSIPDPGRSRMPWSI